MDSQRRRVSAEGAERGAGAGGRARGGGGVAAGRGAGITRVSKIWVILFLILGPIPNGHCYSSTRE